MTDDEVREVEVIVDAVIKANNPVYAKEASLPLAKEVQGLRACFDEVSQYIEQYSTNTCLMGQKSFLTYHP